MKLDTSNFRTKYKVDSEGKYATYKEMSCEVCGRLTTQHDASMLWDGLPTPLCSNECYDKFWSEIAHT